MKLFEEPKLNVVGIEVEDIIATSGDTGGSPDEGGGSGSWGQ